MNVAQVWPDSGERFPFACCAGDGGITMRWWHAGHWICFPPSRSSHCRCCVQCGQENLKSLMCGSVADAVKSTMLRFCFARQRMFGVATWILIIAPVANRAGYISVVRAHDYARLFAARNTPRVTTFAVTSRPGLRAREWRPCLSWPGAIASHFACSTFSCSLLSLKSDAPTWGGKP